MLRLFILFALLLLSRLAPAQFVLQPLEKQDPTAAGYPSKYFEGFTKELRDSFPALGSFVVWREGGIVYENYFHGCNAGTAFNIKSITKSVVSAMAGIAYDKGLLTDLNKPVISFFPEYAKPRNVPGVFFAGEKAWNDSMRSILTLKHLLTMQPGFEWSDFGPVVQAFINSSDPVKFTLDIPFADQPGTKFVYCSAGTSVFAAALEKLVKTDLKTFVQTNLFDPAGITLERWDVDPTGRYFGASEMYLTARDLLRFGLLYLHQGKAGYKTILSKEWVEISTAAHAKLDYWDVLPNANGYGYYWWRRKSNGLQAIIASGAGGQLITIIPELNMVIVATTLFTNKSRGRDELRRLHLMIDKVTAKSPGVYCQ